MYVTDAHGTIISIAYDAEVARADNSAGRNYSWRTYFHGGQDDLPRDTPISSIHILMDAHLSAPFRSTATYLWKVAVSRPVFLNADNLPDAVFVVTLNLGDFQLPESEEGADQVAVLVDARQGDTRGVVLQHPLMDTRASEQMYKVPRKLMDQLISESDVDYSDPMAEAEGGDPYGGPWIAAMQPVSLPDEDGNGPAAESQQTDLMVLVQYRLAKVFAPVGKMTTDLLWNGVVVVVSILVVTFALWYFVRRDSESRAAEANKDSVDQSMAETIAADS
jgi:hypothetical protein